MELYFVTSNPHKVKEANAILGQTLKTSSVDLKEVQAIQVHDVVTEKAKEAYKVLGKPLIVEDTGLYINSLNGFPGALVKWLLRSIGAEGVCKLIKDTKDRSAYAETCICYTDGSVVKIFSGKISGTISDAPRGSNGLGWDPIFVPEGHDLTFAEMPMEEKNKVSHRAKAFLEFKAYWKSKQ